MAWTEPKKDWKMGDAPSNGDFNRIEGNIKHIMDLKGVANGLATLNGNKKIPMAELLAGVAGGLATLGNNGKVPKIQLPTTVEVKTLADKTTNIAPETTITKTITFEDDHKVAIIIFEGILGCGGIGIMPHISTGANGIFLLNYIRLSTDFEGEKYRPETTISKTTIWPDFINELIYPIDEYGDYVFGGCGSHILPNSISYTAKNLIMSFYNQAPVSNKINIDIIAIAI